MAETSQAQNSTRRGRRLKWSEAMNFKLLECKVIQEMSGRHLKS